MKSTAIFGRVPRAYYLFAGMVLAVVALVLVMAFADAKPAEAEGEIWYGTVELRGTGTHTYGDGISVTNNSVLRYEAPTDARYATLFATLDVTENYPDPIPGDSTNCYLARTKTYGTYTGPGYINVNDPQPEDGNRYALWFEPRTASEDEFDNQSWIDWDYSGACGPNPDYTERNGNNGEFMGSIYSGQNAKTYFRAGQLTDPPEGDDLAYAHSKFCSSGHSPGQECATFAFPAGATAQWSLAANPCSGYSKAWNIGNGDRLILFNPCQTKSLSARTSFLDDITGTPKVCQTNFSNVPDVSDWSESKVKRILEMTKKAAKRLNQTCTAYKAVQRIQWAQNDWFMHHAGISGECGLWVVDDASWRPPKIKPATKADTGSALSGISPGQTRNVKTATGSMPVTC